MGRNFFDLPIAQRIDVEDIRKKINQVLIKKKPLRKYKMKYTSITGKPGTLEVDIIPLIKANNEYLGTMILSQVV